ncbi:hypothetical protein HYT58_02255 [Candidatus Woesearchaeota archaeon]|nr:hypothetical protein [Candidatus Woesearchaeota archaeon]
MPLKLLIDDKFKECSEYRCRSLGMACELINAGTSDQSCVDVNPNDINSPLISPWPEALPGNYTLAIEQQGYSIKPIFEPFEKITFGIKTDEYAQCKIQATHAKNYDEMTNFLSETFKKEHNITMFLPDGNEYAFYIRCQDKRGNKNVAEYAVRFATRKGPDRIPPTIERTFIDNNAYIPNGIGNITLGISLNEPAYCKWSKADKDYSSMENEFICDTVPRNDTTSFFNLYDCFANAENIQDGQDNVFYFRCSDLSNNTNQESYKYTLKGSRAFAINSVSPTGSIYDLSPVLKVVTSGGAENGKSTCNFATADVAYEQMIEMFETNSNMHRQQFTNITPGLYEQYITCRDIAGNEAKLTNQFYADIDIAGPNLKNVWVDSSVLHIVLTESSTCEYSTQQDIAYGKGTKMSGIDVQEHTAPALKNAIYRIACVDKNGNQMPLIKVYTKG